MQIFSKIKELIKRKEKRKITTDQSIIIISHDDVDGIICASIIKRNYKEGFYIPSSPRSLPFHLSSLNVNDKKIFISDLSPNDEYLRIIASDLDRLIKSGCEITWIDHHQWTEKALETLRNKTKIVVEPTISAAELVAKTLESSDEVINELVIIANDADSANYSLKETININRAIRNKKRLQYVFEALSEGRINDEKIIKWASKEEKNDSKIKETVKKLKVFTTKNGYRYAIIDVRKSKLPGSISGKYASLEHKLDFTVVIYSNRSVSFYAGLNKEINLLPIARKFNGGGHPFACGCSPKLSLKSRILDKLLGKRYTAKEIKNILKEVSEL